MIRRPGIASLLLLLAALSSPAAASTRPLDSLRLVASITWLRGEEAETARQPANAPRLYPHAAVVVIARSSERPRPHSTALPPSLFQRPPPAARAL